MPSPSKLKPWSAARLTSMVVICLAGWLVTALACVAIGSRGRLGWPADSFTRQFRVDVVLISSLVGAVLAAAGVAYQAILRNPLADPYLLGVSSGASLCAYLWRLPMAGMITFFPIAMALSQQAAAFVGAVVIVAIVLLLATRRGRLEPITLLLVGVLVNSILAALFLLLNTLMPDLTAGLGGPMGFLVGSIQTDLTRSQKLTASAFALGGGLVLLSLAGRLNTAALVEAEALSLGIRLQRLRWIVLVTASLMTASAVSISGSIGFVGLICPHIARRLVGADHRKLLPAAAALGAALLCLADAATRWLSAPGALGTQAPVGVLTALLGGPFFLYLLAEGGIAGRNGP